MLKSPSEALFLIVFLLSVWSEGVGEGTADRNHLTTIPMLKAGTTLQVSKAFLGCRAHAQAEFQQFQGQRRFAWYLNFKATLGALPINPTQSAQPPLLPHHHSMQCTPSLFCIALHWKMKKKSWNIPSLWEDIWAQRLFSKAEKEVEWIWIPFWSRGSNKAHLLWFYITSRVIHPCERVPPTWKCDN